MQFPELIAEVSASALRHNIAALRANCRPGTKLCIPLKADAYGHGMTQVASVLADSIDSAALATLDEAITLRRAGWTKPLLVLGAVISTSDAADRRARIEAAIQHDLVLTLAEDAYLSELSVAATAAKRTIELHLKVDTGLGRMGLTPSEALGLLQKARSLPGRKITGVYSHFGTADLSNHDLIDHQLTEFRGFMQKAGDWLGAGVVQHFANTAATMTRSDAHFDMVRPGIGTFGLLPADGFADRIGLRPAMRIVSRISAVKTLPKGHCVGYGGTVRTTRETRLGLIPAGYHDGFLRALSNRAVVGTAAGDAPVMGRISMDQLAVDLTDLPSVGTASPITLLDNNSSRPNSAASLATLLGTISYEVVCGLGPRIQRVIVD